ncbi:Flp family type IVb pilin [Mesorhizobium sp. ASY16-5R]|uniref:Flp family type IVb pilin n=1 Tax=Mesorhizobium sp. ASY16-5R TaxID=3445772 RepID=UPI003F9F3360
MNKMIRRFLKDENGATAIEYGLIIALISLAIVAGVGGLADQLEFLWGDNNSEINKGLNFH